MSNVDYVLDGETFPANERRTLQFVIDDLITCFLTDELLQEAQDSVARTVQRPVE